MKGTWRSVAAPIIRKVLLDNEGQDEKVIRKALRDAYPFGRRTHYPYKVWIDEIRKQRGISSKRKTVAPNDKNQPELF